MGVSSTIPVEQIEREDLRALIADQLKQDNLDLPLLPVVANQVLMFSHDPNGNAYKLSTLIQQDQALASKILHMPTPRPIFLNRRLCPFIRPLPGWASTFWAVWHSPFRSKKGSLPSRGMKRK